MGQIQLINSVFEWERRLEIEDERRQNHRSEPYVNYLAPPQSCRTERKPFFARFFQQGKESQPPADFIAALNFHLPTFR